MTLGTCYQYDALNDLTAVAEGGQPRSYSFDGLGRETSETTPEAGLVNYAFAASGGGLCAGDPKQVCQRTDARGITTTYSYDAENRLTSKTYSDSTPAAYYYYDESSVSVAGTNYSVNDGKGRLTHTTADGGNCSTGTLWDMKYYYYPGGEESG
ncbi:MAG: hypothetical protein ACRD2B_10160 [Terriglobia bacterium]